MDKNKDALLAKRWAMVVDMSKFKTDEEIKKSIDACHLTHNVPDFRNADGTVNKKDEIKWIWKAPYEHAFPGQENKYMSEHIKDMPFIVLCNHCENPPCVRVCPTQATFKLAERDHDAGHAPLHRLPVLHGRLSLRGPELQLAGPPAGHQAREREQGISRRGPRAWWKNAPSAPSGLRSGNCRPASRRRPRAD